MADIIIHGFPQSSYVWTVRAVCAAKGVSYELDTVAPDELTSDEHLARHPFGKVPAMTHDGFVLYESSAIARYIDESFEGPYLTPGDPKGRARMEQWISVATSYLYPQAVIEFAFGYIFPGTEDGAPNRAKIDASLPALRKTYGLINEAVSESKWMVGNQPTLADFFIAPLILVASNFSEGEQLLAENIKVAQYVGRALEMPAIVRTSPPRPED